MSVLQASVDGSSPRARGTRARASRSAPRGRFIPACAGNTGRERASHGSAPVHPRVRGEHQDSLVSLPSLAGSSPRARGTPGQPRVAAVAGRFIPACAGNTYLTPTYWEMATVHPRVRGEHVLADEALRVGDGSSPRARGTPGGFPAGVPLSRFIPACAGNTAAWHGWSTPPAVHPRVRGEHTRRRRARRSGRGSSPRARGTQQRHVADHVVRRFIPACAGNTRRRGRSARRLAVHPRVRGEHVAHRATNMVPRGSSPRARGTPRWRCRSRLRPRFIPACAGNTRSDCAIASVPAVHPRVRGEHERGELRLRHLRRFIPACAGNTQCSCARPAASAVHPRVRGEHRGQRRRVRAEVGSSPRARGTLDRDR